MRNFKNIVITGGAGFIGGCMVRKLIKETDYRIFVIDFMGYASDLSWLKNYSYIGNRFSHFKIDISNDDDVSKVIKIADPDLILHLAENK